MVALVTLKLQSKSPSQIAWFFDFDGSLCPHLEVWEEKTYNSPDIYARLLTLSQKGSSVLWNTGRRPESLGNANQDFLNFDGYFVQGSIFWDAKTQSRELIGTQLPEDVVSFYEDAFAKEKFLSLGYRLEVKPTSLRIAPFTEEAFQRLPEILDRFPLDNYVKRAWHWHVGARAAELLARNVDKGSALRHALPRLPQGQVPVAIGDDLLDKPAVEEALKAGGYAILVGEHCGWVTEIPHQSSQVVFKSTPQGVLDFLKNY